MRAILFVALFAVAFAAETKNALSADADRLKQLANTEIQKLAAEGKSFLAKELQVLENEIIAVEKKLVSLNPSTEIGRIGVSALETVLKGLEGKLEAEVKKLSTGAYYAAIQRDRLRSESERLRRLAQEEIRRLEGLGKSTLAQEIRVLEEEIIAVEKKIEAANPLTESGKLTISSLETVLIGLEEKLQRDIRRLNGGVFYAAIQRDRLRSESERLRRLAQEEIRKFESLGKSSVAQEIRVLEEEIIAIEKKIEAANPLTEAGKLTISSLETVLIGLEERLQRDLRRLNGVFYAAVQRDRLRSESERLRRLAQEEIRRLEGLGKSSLTQEIRVLEEEIIAVEKKIEAANPLTESGKIAINSLETVLIGLEEKLQRDIRRLNGGVFYAAIQRDRLRSESERLRRLAQEEIRRFESLGKSSVAQEIRVLEEEIIAIEKKIEAANPLTEAGKLTISSLETVLIGLEERLQRDLRRLNGGL